MACDDSVFVYVTGSQLTGVWECTSIAIQQQTVQQAAGYLCTVHVCRNNVSRFDYFHEDSTSSDLTLHKKQKKLPPGI